MFNTNFLLKLITCNASYYVSKILFLSIFFILDFFSLFILGNYLGIFLYLGILGLIIVILTLIAISLIKKINSKIETFSKNGLYPQKEFYSITGLYAGVFLIIIPGIVTTILGSIIILPKLRTFFGERVTKKFSIDWNNVYEYKEIFKQ